MVACDLLELRCDLYDLEEIVSEILPLGVGGLLVDRILHLKSFSITINYIQSHSIILNHNQVVSSSIASSTWGLVML